MDEDWDLYAVVRSCKTSTTTTTSSASATESIPANINMTNSEDDAYFPNFESLSFGNNENQFFIHQALNNRNINDPFQRLQEVQGEFTLNNQSPPTIPSVSPTIGFQHQPSQNLQQIVHREQFYPSTISFPVVNPQPVRPRRRKNQQSKVVRQMTQDQLSTDSWAWRKYGQKPIKGSPYPRNYYKCSTSKGCAARKQVERNPTDPNVYIVSYTGEHTHPRPTHRSSLAGSTRTKFSTPLTNNTTTSNNNLASEAIKAPCSSSSPVASGSSFSPSPNTPSKDGDNNDEDNDDDDDDVFIPNVVMDEDIFKGFGDINEMNIYNNGSGDDDQTGVSSGLFSPPWTPPSSSGSNTRFAGGGGG